MPSDTLPPYLHALSLGTHCYTACLLRRAGLRQFSGPFDWLFANPAMVRHCLETDFAVLLDRSLYEPVPLEARAHPEFYRCHHAYYRDTFGVSFVFNHHDVWQDEGYAYLTRCVARFRDAAAEGPVLGLQVRAEHAWQAGQDFEATADHLDRYRPGMALRAVSVSGEPAVGEARLELLAQRDRHRLYRLQPTGRWFATHFEHAADEAPLAALLQAELDAATARSGAALAGDP